MVLYTQRCIAKDSRPAELGRMLYRERRGYYSEKGGGCICGCVHDTIGCRTTMPISFSSPDGSTSSVWSRTRFLRGKAVRIARVEPG